MVKTLILYESKYGFTEMISKNLSLILGPAKYCRASEFKGDIDNFEFIVICSPIYSECIDNRILELVRENVNRLSQKKIILLCSCLAENMAEQYLKPLKKMLGQCVALQSAIIGEVNVDKLSNSDNALMKSFYNHTGFSLNNFKPFDKSKFVGLALRIKKIKDEGEKVIEGKVLKTYIEGFIKAHNTCALATGHGESVRSTPIEYIFLGECIYMFSEGGEKFSNIIMNPNVSVSIYDAFKNMDELGGMQITGVAELIDTGSEEYISILTQKNLNYDKIISLPMALNLVKINIRKTEFLWSGFAKLGFDVKQTLSD
jgi:menaquinone-dependent protoporphyrinogen IX oxidase